MPHIPSQVWAPLGQPPPDVMKGYYKAARSAQPTNRQKPEAKKGSRPFVQRLSIHKFKADPDSVAQIMFGRRPTRDPVSGMVS